MKDHSKLEKKYGFEEVALADFQAAKRQLPPYLVSRGTAIYLKLDRSKSFL